jgi:agmatinase
MSGRSSDPVGPVDGRKVPRFAGSGSFARLPEIDRVPDYDVAVLGVPFDNGTSYRPGARFGPMAVRQASRHLRPGHHVELDCSPFAAIQVVDAGDVPVTPFSIDEAIGQIAGHAADLLQGDRKVIAIGGDHTIALPMLRSVNRVHGPVALVHFDAHLDTWDTYFNAPTTHGTIFRRAFEENLLVEDHSIHVGIRGPIYGRADLDDDRRFGFRTIRASDVDDLGVAGTIGAITERAGDLPVYLSIDIDVLDPSFAPGTGTPEAGGLTSRELLRVLRGLTSLNLVSADLVEVSPAYDHAEITSIAAATVIFDLVALLGLRSLPSRPRRGRPSEERPGRAPQDGLDLLGGGDELSGGRGRPQELQLVVMMNSVRAWQASAMRPVATACCAFAT